MTPEDKKILLSHVNEYVNSLTMIAAERDHLKAIAIRVKDTLDIPEKQFVVLAKAQYNDAVGTLRDELDKQLDLLNLVCEPIG